MVDIAKVSRCRKVLEEMDTAVVSVHLWALYTMFGRLPAKFFQLGRLPDGCGALVSRHRSPQKHGGGSVALCRRLDQSADLSQWIFVRRGACDCGHPQCPGAPQRRLKPSCCQESYHQVPHFLSSTNGMIIFARFGECQECGSRGTSGNGHMWCRYSCGDCLCSAIAACNL